jgi:hypothetical protein
MVRRFASAFLIVLLVPSPYSAAQAPYGELAPGAISYSEMSGVDAEICRDHLFDSSSVELR